MTPVTARRAPGLLDAALALAREHEPEQVLDRLVASAAALTWARYAALAVYDDAGTRTWFGEHGAAPAGQAAGAQLGVPVSSGGRRHGHLFVADKHDGQAFDEEDERCLLTLAAFAAAAVEGAETVAARERARAQQELLARVIEAQEAERARVARDLHDEIGQALTSVLLGLHLVDTAVTVSPVDPARAMARTAEVRALVADALRQVRRLAFDLRPTVLDDLGLAAALQRLATNVTERHGVAVRLHGDAAYDGTAGASRRLPGAVETVVYRVVQEALTNVVRHARAARVDVTLRVDETAVQATVADDGVGFRPEEHARSLGLRGVAERAELAGGTVAVRSAPGRGTTVTLEVPRG